jgi:hypothetical protein
MAGCVVLMLLGTLHLIATSLVPPPAPKSDDEKTLERLMTTVQMEYPGAKRTTQQIFTGFSIFLDIVPNMMGLAGLAVATVRPRPAAALKRLSIVYAVGSAAMLVNSILHWFMIPTPIIGLATLCFLLAVFLDGKQGPSGVQT